MSSQLTLVYPDYLNYTLQFLSKVMEIESCRLNGGTICNLKPEKRRINYSISVKIVVRIFRLKIFTRFLCNLYDSSDLGM